MPQIWKLALAEDRAFCMGSFPGEYLGIDFTRGFTRGFGNDHSGEETGNSSIARL